jgi:6-pyruvoyl-tetrahydropterin synthase
MQLFVNDLTVMDFSYLCPQRGIVGESWIVDVVLDGALNDESMVQDFGKVKKNLKRLIDSYVDHKLLIPAEHNSASVRHDSKTEQVEVGFVVNQEQEIRLFCPAEAYAFIYASEVTMTSVGEYLKEVIATHLPDNVADIELILRNEVITTPFYHYTHGLKKHDGNCQRIAHGHRSKIDIFTDNQVDLDSQEYWAKRWQDIYIASTEDLVNPDVLKMTKRLDDYSQYYCLAYEASQGHFEMVIPKQYCEVITTDSTVECLAQFIFQQQQQRIPNKTCRVLAYEGVGKGAMVSA